MSQLQIAFLITFGPKYMKYLHNLHNSNIIYFYFVSMYPDLLFICAGWIFWLKILRRGMGLKNFVKLCPNHKIVPVFPVLRSKVQILRRFLTILRRRASPCLQLLEALLYFFSPHLLLVVFLHVYFIPLWSYFYLVIISISPPGVNTKPLAME